MDITIFEPIIHGVVNAFEVQAQVQSKPGKPFYKGTEKQEPTAIAGVIGLASSKISGSVTLAFPEVVFLGTMSKMLGEEYTEITPDLQDGVAEILNIVFGQAKTALNEKGYGLDMAIPTIISGKGISLEQMSHGKTIVIPFNTEFGPFYIEITIDGA